MAEAQRITGIIDSLERHENTESGWGKYTVYLEGERDPFDVRVPKDIHEKYTLDEGFDIALTKGKFKGWIVTKKSAFYEDDEGFAKTERSSPRSNGSEKDVPHRYKASSRSTKVGDDYVLTRDSKIELQEWGKICRDVYVGGVSAGLSPEDCNDIIDSIVNKAKSIVKQLH